LLLCMQVGLSKFLIMNRSTLVRSILTQEVYWLARHAFRASVDSRALVLPIPSKATRLSVAARFTSAVVKGGQCVFIARQICVKSPKNLAKW